MRFDNSLKLKDEAAKYIPNATQTAGKCFNQWAQGTAPIFVKSGKGCILKCVDGNKYIDMLSAFGPTILGYNHPKVNAAIKKQLRNGIIFSLSHEIELDLARLVVDTVPSVEMVKFAKTGTDVCNAAARIARSYTGKKDIMLFDGHYHGWGDTFAASSNRSSGVVEELGKHVVRAKYNDLQSVEDAIKKFDIAAIMLEPVSLVPPTPDFLINLRMLCNRHNIILIFDEIITGFRWSLRGAQGYYGIWPDITLFSKAISNGMPLSVIGGRAELMQEVNKIFFSGTFFGDTLSIAAAVATIKVLRENADKIYDHIWGNGRRIKKAFDMSCASSRVNAEMVGLPPRYNFKFNGYDSHGMSDLFRQEMIKNGVFVGSQFYVTWAHKEKHIKKVITAIEKSIAVVGDAVKEGTIDNKLQCIERSHTVFKDNVSKK